MAAVSTSVARERLVPTAECEVGRQDQRAAFVTLRDDLEERIWPARVRMADSRSRRRSMISSFGAAITRCITSFIRPCRYAASIAMTRSAAVVKRAFQPLRRDQSKRDREVCLAGAARAEQDDILGALNEA